MNADRPSLEGARAKLARSLELLQELENEMDTERTSVSRSGDPPFRFGFHSETDYYDNQWLVCRCQRLIPRPPVRWGVLVGDAMHNARSALDHLASRLVELEGNEPSKTTAFPIYDEPPVEKDRLKRFERMIAGMSETHKEGLRRLQPYSQPGTKESAMLIALAVLDNLDKHKQLVPLVATTAPDLHLSPSSPALQSEAEVRWNPGVEVKPGIEIFRMRPLTVAGSGGLNVGVAVRVTFGDASTGIRELHEIRTHCVGIIESFAPDFN